jgi:hypothetical protein
MSTTYTAKLDTVGDLSGAIETATAGRKRCWFATFPPNSEGMGFWVNAPDAMWTNLQQNDVVHVVGDLRLRTTPTGVQYTIYPDTMVFVSRPPF